MSTPGDPRSKRALEELLKGEEGLDVETLNRLADSMAEERANTILQQRRPDSVKHLKDLCAAYHAPAAGFERGDIVRWKAGLKNKRHPAYDIPAIVWNVLDSPTVNTSDSSGSQYFKEPLDIQIAYFLDDGDVGVYHVDGQRFELHPDFTEDKP